MVFSRFLWPGVNECLVSSGSKKTPVGVFNTPRGFFFDLYDSNPNRWVLEKDFLDLLLSQDPLEIVKAFFGSKKTSFFAKIVSRVKSRKKMGEKTRVFLEPVRVFEDERVPKKAFSRTRSAVLEMLVYYTKLREKKEKRILQAADFCAEFVRRRGSSEEKKLAERISKMVEKL